MITLELSLMKIRNNVVRRTETWKSPTLMSNHPTRRFVKNNWSNLKIRPDTNLSYELVENSRSPNHVEWHRRSRAVRKPSLIDKFINRQASC